MFLFLCGYAYNSFAFLLWRFCLQIFFLKGRLIFGPDARSLLLTIFLIVAPVAAFCVSVARKLTDDFPHHWGTSIVVIAVVLTSFVSFFPPIKATMLLIAEVPFFTMIQDRHS